MYPVSVGILILWLVYLSQVLEPNWHLMHDRLRTAKSIDEVCGLDIICLGTLMNLWKQYWIYVFAIG